MRMWIARTLYIALVGSMLGSVPGMGQTTRPAKVIEDKDLGAYLLVYFKDDTHGLYFALSRDGYSFTDVNSARPVMEGKDLAEQQGIRDPHITRGPDGAFYLAMTDLHLFAKRLGLRETEWQRPGEQYGWGNNRALVLMKSKDLIHWSHTIFRVDTAFPELGDIGCAWAPQTIYDDAAGKLMVYFTIRFGKGPNQLYYSYANDDFTKLEMVPRQLFKYPRENVNVLDADITRFGDKFHMFYVAHERPGNIRQAVSDRINEGYVFDPRRIDPERASCEAPNVWRRTGTNTYVLMYDIFGIKPHNFGFCETTDFVEFKDIGRFNEGVMKSTNFTSPKHGAVIPLMDSEAKALAAHWKFDFQ